MFNPYADLSSTGEPPTTVSSGTTRNNSSQTLTDSNISQHETSQLSLSSSSSRSLSVQEPDSGYEASPSSIADNQRFFGEQSVAVGNRSEVPQSSNVNSDDEFDIVECHSQIILDESDSDELNDYDTCIDCCSSLSSCNCYRTESSNTNATSNCDNSRCNSSQSRPSSHPIQVPLCRMRSNGRPGVEIYPQTRSQPIALSPLQRLGLIPERYPRVMSWPSSPSTNIINIAFSPPRNNILTNIIPRSRRNSHPARSRRQMIDSEASSNDPSDDEIPEDVFNMPAEEASSYPVMTVGSGPLPDVVLESTDSGRRSRSMSVNIPPNRERTYHDIGQSLRRMSDLFERRHQFNRMMRGRSRTTSDCDDLHRNGVP